MADNDICILIAHERRFVAASISSLLDGNGFEVVANVRSTRELDEVFVDCAPDICIVGAKERDFGGLCSTLRTRYPDSRLVLVDASDPSELVRLSNAHGLDGCLSLDLTPEMIASGLRLVSEGVRVCQHNDVVVKANGTDLSPVRETSLTPRECAVLELIGQGMANKVIARRLGISESTVKAHLNAVLRKTGTANRTQAARWAFDHGQIAC